MATNAGGPLPVHAKMIVMAVKASTIRQGSDILVFSRFACLLFLSLSVTILKSAHAIPHEIALHRDEARLFIALVMASKMKTAQKHSSQNSPLQPPRSLRNNRIVIFNENDGGDTSTVDGGIVRLGVNSGKSVRKTDNMQQKSYMTFTAFLRMYSTTSPLGRGL